MPVFSLFLCFMLHLDICIPKSSPVEWVRERLLRKGRREEVVDQLLERFHGQVESLMVVFLKTDVGCDVDAV